MSDGGHGGAKLVDQRSLTACRLQGAIERMACLLIASQAEERFAAQTVDGGKRLLLAARFGQCQPLVQQRQGLTGMAEYPAGGAHAGELERKELPAPLGACSCHRN